jgi:hypothetical protein
LIANLLTFAGKLSKVRRTFDSWRCHETAPQKCVSDYLLDWSGTSARMRLGARNSCCRHEF